MLTSIGMSMREKTPSRTGFSLLAIFVGLGALSSAVWWFADRGPSSQRSSLARDGAGNDLQLASLHLPEPLAAGADVQRSPLDGGAKAPVVELAPATISGRLQIDGFAPYHGRVHFRRENGVWERTASIDPYGRFYLEGVPAAALSLSFQAEWLEERPLLLPNEFLFTPAPGKTEFVDLDWKTRQLNVQVVAGDDLPSRARVDIAGPNYRASFDTNERGKAKLSLVGSGRFSLRAELPSGKSGEAAVELEEGDELETVVISAERR